MGEVALIILCYNEAERLPVVSFVQFAQAHPDHCYLFVDGGSCDTTANVLKRLESINPDQFAVLTLDRNRGKAEAVRQGILYILQARLTGSASSTRRICSQHWVGVAQASDYVGFWDADLAAPLAELPAMRMVLESYPHVHLVYGSRVRLLGRRIERRAVRHYVGRCMATIAPWAVKLPIYDSQCGAKLFRIDSMPTEIWAQPFRWLFNLEILVRWRRVLERNSLDKQPWDWSSCEPIGPFYEYPLRVWRDVRGSKITLWDSVRPLEESIAFRFSYIVPSTRERGLHNALDESRVCLAESRIVAIDGGGRRSCWLNERWYTPA